jgi:hypothetical protein
LCVAAFDELSLLPVVQWTHRSVTRYGRGVFCAAKLHVPIFSGSLWSYDVKTNGGHF